MGHFMKNVKVARLSSGEYIICKMSENQDGTVTLLESLGFQMVPSGDSSKQGLAFYVAFPFAEDPANVTLPQSAVLYSMQPNAQIQSAFIEKTSGLVTPSSSGKIIS
jgi:hypothetical protein